MRILVYLGALVIMLMAFEVNASWQEFEEAQIDISSWLYQESSKFEDWSNYLILGSATSKSIKIEEKSLSSNNTIVAVAQRITNVSNTPYCLIAELKGSNNTDNIYLRNGRTIVSPNETRIIGGYRVDTTTKGWKVNWSFQTSTQLENCR